MYRKALWTACIAALCLFGAVEASAQSFTTLLSFNGADGESPYYGPLVQGTDGNFYGTTEIGGTYGYGTVFQLSPATSAGCPSGSMTGNGWCETVLYNFCALANCTDGDQPTAALLQATNGNFYGTTVVGGTGECAGRPSCGTVFEVTPAGKLTTLYSFCSQSGCPDGAGPFAGLVQATKGDFYGTTSYGGSSDACTVTTYTVGCGTVFRMTPMGKLTTIYNFCTTGYPYCSDGYEPSAGGLVQAANGNFYGTTFFGGANNWGTLFEISPEGNLTTLHSFCSETNCADGSTPSGSLIQAADGNLYGTTSSQGANLGGTIFQITPEGILTTLYSFCLQGFNCTVGTVGEGPEAGLVQGTNGDFYGTTVQGGGSSNCTYGCGTIFELSQQGGAWSLTTLHSFDFNDGWYPFALLQATNGSFYGTAYYGGTDSAGSAFSLSVGLLPFVKTNPTSGSVGTAVIILGNNLTGATSVSFNGTAATFTVVSSTEIMTTVPSGATTGIVQATTPSGTLNSNVPFVVTLPWQQVPGSLSQLSVGSDGTVWGLSSAGQTYMFNSQTQTWQQAPGLLTQIAVASNGVVWGLNAAGQIYRYDPATQGWDQISGILSQIAVGSDGDVWGINASSQVYHFNAATQTWVQAPGALAQIAVGYDGTVWGLNAAHQIFRFNPGTQNWQQVAGLLKQVAVGGDGDVWGINSAGQTFHFNTLSQQWQNTGASLAQIAVGSGSNVWGIDSAGGIWNFNGQAQAWNQVPGQLAQIAVGENGAVWGLNSANQIYQFVQPTQATQTFHPFAGPLAQVAVGLDGGAWGIDGSQQVWHFDAQRQSWQQIPGGLSQIAVGFGGNVWGLNAAGQIWQFNPSTQGWGAIGGSLAQIAVGADGSVWGLNSAGQIWRFNSTSQSFQQISGSLAQIAVGADGTVWGLNSAGQIFRFNPSTQGWDQIPGSLSQIAVGSANNVWGINATGQVFRYDSLVQSWDSIPGILTSLAVAFDGTVWGLNSANQIWRFNAQTQGWDSIAGQLTQISVGADAVVWGVNASGQTYEYW